RDVAADRRVGGRLRSMALREATVDAGAFAVVDQPIIYLRHVRELPAERLGIEIDELLRLRRVNLEMHHARHVPALPCPVPTVNLCAAAGKEGEISPRAHCGSRALADARLRA